MGERVGKRRGNKTPKARGHGAIDRAARRAKAEARQTERDKRSPKEQVKMLDAKLGVGVGAKRERARLVIK